MFRSCCFIFLVLLLSGASPALPAAEEDTRPRIGLALSGGGARGGAHVGVLKMLEELDVPVDYIAGTSMGAIVGALYASGYSAAEIEVLLRETKWSSALSDKPRRRDQTMRKKELDRRALIPYRVGFNGGEFQFPMGVVEGQHLDQMFHRYLSHVADIRDFNALPIPFRAVATDLETGDEVVLSSGSLADAIRASMSVPAFFAPVRLGGKLLVDGGMANNLPVSVVREMGADIVIAVDISTPLLKGSELESVLSVSEQLTNFLTRKNTETQIASLGEHDVLIVPELKGFTSADFERSAELAEIGYEASKAYQQRLESLPAARSATPVSRVSGTTADFGIEFIELNNQSLLDDEIILSRIGVRPGDKLDFSRMDRNMDRIYALDVFESVTYSVITNDLGENGLLVEALPRAWGPNYLQAGLEFSDDFQGNSDYKVSAAYTRNALNPYGGELRVLGAFGREDELSFNFYQPVDKQARWFAEAQVGIRRNQFNVYLDNTLISELEIDGAGAAVGFGRNFNSMNRVQLDYRYFSGEADERVGPPGFVVSDDVEIGELVLSFAHDSLDSLHFPTDGYLTNITYSHADDRLGAEFDYEQATFQATAAHAFGRNIIMGHVEAAHSFDDLAPLERSFELGGFGRLSGLVPDQLFGRHLGLFSLAYMRKLVDVDFAPVYAGVSLERGNVWDLEDNVSLGDMQNAGSIFVGAETPLGPVYLAWGYHESGQSTLYFYLGNPFGLRDFRSF